MPISYNFAILICIRFLPITQINAGSPFLGLSAVFNDAFIDTGGVVLTCCFDRGGLVIDSFLLSTST